MDEVQKYFHGLRFENDFLKLKGNSFQDLFADIMDLRYPGDFRRSRPWGNLGDRKNDGYLKSKRMLFGVYAPDEMGSGKKAVKKIEDDFLGALPYWRSYFDCWVFVHNSYRGLGPPHEKKLLELDDHCDDVSVARWGYAELRSVALGLSPHDLALRYGMVPTSRHFADVRFNDIRDVMLAVADSDPSPDTDLRPVPPEKLQFNELSTDVQSLVSLGMSKAPRVEQFLHNWPSDPHLGDRVAETLTGEYERLRDERLPPNLIFGELLALLRAPKAGDPSFEGAALAVLTYFFEQCAIFERPPAGWSSNGSSD